jgi:hypothetical protein
MLSKLLIDNTKPQAKSVRLSDGRGMYLEISPAGGKWWRFKYRFAGKERRISLGVYPDVPLAAAREKREEARRQKSPPASIRASSARRPRSSSSRASRTLSRPSRACGLACSRRGGSRGHADKIIRRRELNVFPWLGERPIKDALLAEIVRVRQ